MSGLFEFENEFKFEFLSFQELHNQIVANSFFSENLTDGFSLIYLRNENGMFDQKQDSMKFKNQISRSVDMTRMNVGVNRSFTNWY